jgi:hypothetical protein
LLRLQNINKRKVSIKAGLDSSEAVMNVAQISLNKYFIQANTPYETADYALAGAKSPSIDFAASKAPISEGHPNFKAIIAGAFLGLIFSFLYIFSVKIFFRKDIFILNKKFSH